MPHRSPSRPPDLFGRNTPQPGIPAWKTLPDRTQYALTGFDPRRMIAGMVAKSAVPFPRDREGSFGPELVRNGQTGIGGMDDEITDLARSVFHIHGIRKE